MVESILIVDDEHSSRELLKKALGGGQYNIRTATNGEEALILVAKKIPDLILLDIQMPIMNGLEVCKRLKADPTTNSISILFITASRTTSEDQIGGLNLGALDYITKPFDPKVVAARVKNYLMLKQYQNQLEHLVALKTIELEKTQRHILECLAKAGEMRDDDTGSHLKRISMYVLALLEHLNWENKTMREMGAQAASLHDLGKIGVPDAILRKPGILTPEEGKIMQLHTITGALIIGDHPAVILKMAQKIALEHHENWDGTGYPYGIKGNNISFLAAVVHLADVYDALRTERPYKIAFPHERAVEIITIGEGIRTLPEHFHPDVLQGFKEIEGEFAEIALEYANEVE